MIAQMKDKKKLVEKIHHAVCQMYEEVSTNPLKGFHFPIGFNAALAVGYPAVVLKMLPLLAVESFAGVSYHFKNNAIQKGDFVLDIGAGSGTDVLVAAKLVGQKGRVVGIDITEAMIEKAKKAAMHNGFSNVSLLKANAEQLPIEDGSVDVVISNGVINLVPDKRKVFREIHRVLKPGGILSIADIVLGNPISEESRQDPKLWAECVVGALLEESYLGVIKQTGFTNTRIVDRLDYFSHSSSANTKEVAKENNAHAIVLRATKPHSTNATVSAKGGEIA